MPQLTDQELSQIREEAHKEYPYMGIDERGIYSIFEMYEYNDDQYTKREVYISALTKERTKAKELVAGANNLITHLRKREQDWNTMHYIEKLEYLISNYQNKQQ